MQKWTFGEIRKTNPIQTQSNPILSAVGGFRKAQNELKLPLHKGLQKIYPAGGKKNKPNSNPILSAVGGFQRKSQR